ncbi:MAG: hypothetical protein OSA45_14760 [Halioglobus sp.]|nr:hypothetical protein [Halioglobus sp.]
MSNITMMRKPRIGVALFRMAAVVFFLNTMNVYGACCIEPAANDSATMQMPCQHNGDSNSSEQGNDCCLMCVPMISPDADPDAVIETFATTAAFKNPQPISSGIDPPFRPPIIRLS